MLEYLATYTIYFANTPSDVECFRPLFELDPENFGKNEKWELKKEHYHRFRAVNEKHAIKIAEIHRQGFYYSIPSNPRIGASLDELFEIKIMPGKKVELEIN